MAEIGLRRRPLTYAREARMRTDHPFGSAGRIPGRLRQIFEELNKAEVYISNEERNIHEYDCEKEDNIFQINIASHTC